MKKALVLLVLVTYTAISAVSAMQESLTYDEGVHMAVGMDAWQKRQFTKDPYSPPLVGELAALPAVLGMQTSHGLSFSSVFPSRMIILTLSVLLAIFMYVTVEKILGTSTAIAAIFLFVWEPTILSHNHYVTKDMGVTAFFFISYILFVSLLDKFSWRRIILFGACFGILLASKTSALPFFLCSIGTLCIMRKDYWKRIGKYWKNLAVSFLLAIGVLWATYGFTTDVIIAKREDPGRISAQLMQSAQDSGNTILIHALRFAKDVPIPLGTYLASQKNALLLGRQSSQVFFLGSAFDSVRWYFLPVNFSMKLPLPLLCFFVAACVYMIKKSISFKQMALFIAPVVGIFLFLIISSVKPYVRYSLPLYPFFIIIAALGLVEMIRKGKTIVALLLCIWYTVGTLVYFPHFLSFGNVLAGPRDKRYERLIDSDIDWGQNLMDVASYIKNNNLQTVQFSYFGTDDGNAYGLYSPIPYGIHKKDAVCAFHTIKGTNPDGPKRTCISLSNWYYCGYFMMDQYAASRIIDDIAGTILVFDSTEE